MRTTYHLPRGMRFTKLEERKQFYEREFEIEKVKKWFAGRENTVFAIIIGRHTGIYPQEFKKIKKDIVLIDEYKNLGEVKEYLLQYLPEGAYYDRNVYESREACRTCGKSYRECWNCKGFVGQELAFDVDPENISCPYHGDVEEKMKQHQGLSFCMYEFKAVKKQTALLHQELKKRFSKIRIVYSGRGFHLHVLDKEATVLGKREREKLAQKLSKKFAIDEWVTSGEMRLIRLPYSLHGMVSRICIPLEIQEVENFNFRKQRKCIPKFISTS